MGGIAQQFQNELASHVLLLNADEWEFAMDDVLERFRIALENEYISTVIVCR